MGTAFCTTYAHHHCGVESAQQCVVICGPPLLDGEAQLVARLQPEDLLIRSFTGAEAC